MKVWIVYFSEWDNWDITKVVDSEEKAENEVKWSGGSEKGYHWEEYEVQ